MGGLLLIALFGVLIWVRQRYDGNSKRIDDPNHPLFSREGCDRPFDKKK